MVYMPPDAQRPLFRRAVRYLVEITTDNGNTGSGVVLTRDGLILTAYHVLKGGTETTVRRCRLSDTTWNIIRFGKYAADIVYKHVRADIAVLKLRNPPKTLAVAPLGRSNELDVGTGVYRVGRDEHPLASGHMLCTNKKDGIPSYEFSMESDVGASGGPIFNKRIRLVAMVTETSLAKSDPSETHGLPIDWIRTHILKRKEVKELLPDGFFAP